MPRRAATITQADVARTIRAAKQAGATNVEVRPDGTMFVHFSEMPGIGGTQPVVEDERVLVF